MRFTWILGRLKRFLLLFVLEAPTTTEGSTVGGSRDETDSSNIHPIYLALAVVIFILIALVIAYYFVTRTRRG